MFSLPVFTPACLYSRFDWGSFFFPFAMFNCKLPRHVFVLAGVCIPPPSSRLMLVKIHVNRFL